MLHALALEIDRDRAPEIESRLLAAAGPRGLAASTDGWRRYRRKRLEAAILGGRAPLRLRLAWGLRLHAAAESMQNAVASQMTGSARSDPRPRRGPDLPRAPS